MEENKTLEQINEEVVDTTVMEGAVSNSGKVLKTIGIVGLGAVIIGGAVYLFKRLKNRKNQTVVVTEESEINMTVEENNENDKNQDEE